MSAEREAARRAAGSLRIDPGYGPGIETGWVRAPTTSLQRTLGPTSATEIRERSTLPHHGFGVAVAAAAAVAALSAASASEARQVPELTPQWSRSASAVESGRCGSTRAVVLRSSPSPAAPRPRGADARIEVAGTTHSGYGCGAHAGGDTLPLVHGGPRCRTVFFIDARSGRLGLFYTIQPRYVESHGVRVGMPTATAERLLRQRVIVGCMA